MCKVMYSESDGGKKYIKVAIVSGGDNKWCML